MDFRPIAFYNMPMKEEKIGSKRAVVFLQEWLDSYLNFERTPKKNIFWLDTIRFLCNRFNNPQNDYKSVHVAGSKGKGSVSEMIASILEESGFRSGLYTSPHIVDISERIGTAHGAFNESVYEKALRLLVARVDSIIPEQLPGERNLTWFELITMYGFLCFKEAGVDWAVLETGLGGRLDATNVVQPEASVITPIELEHTEFLGDTLEKIAFEKAGIIKENTPVFFSRQKPEVRKVFEKIAQERNAPAFFLEDFVKSAESSYTQDHKLSVTIEYKNLFSRPIHADLAMTGLVQAENAALAAYVVKKLCPATDETTIERGLEKAYIPGRFEIGHKPCLHVLDGAHTVNSLRTTLESFEKTFGGKTGRLIFACAADKDFSGMIDLILDKSHLFSSIVLTKPGENKKSDLAHLASLFSEKAGSGPAEKVTVTGDYTRAIKLEAEKAAESGEPLLVTGSFYLIAEFKKLFSTE